MNKKPLSLFQMINLNFGFMGIQFGWGLQNANMSGIYKFLGVNTSNLGYLWLAAPIIGMLIQPILGSMSDETWTCLGRRRPYIFVGALTASLALILMPNCTAWWMAASLLFLLDGSINMAMQPYRALVADVAPEKQHTKVYAVQTCLVGIGATIASSMPWILLHIFKIQEAEVAGQIPATIRISFYLGAAVFLLANLWTILSSHEYPPENLETFRQKKKDRAEIDFMIFLKSIITDFVKMPTIMREIAWVQLFSWIGFFAIWAFFSVGVTQNIFGMPINANAANDVQFSTLMEKGVALTGLCFSTYMLVSFVYAYFIPRISKLISRKGAHIFSLLAGALGLIISSTAHSHTILFLGMIGVGMAWASVATVPYAMLAGSLPKEKMGVYMGLFNITICVPQIIAGVTLGAICNHVFHDRAMSVIALAGTFYVIAAIMTLFVHDKKIEEII